MIQRRFLQHEPVGISYLFGCGGQASATTIDTFVRFMAEDIPPAPPEAARLRALNAGATAMAA